MSKPTTKTPPASEAELITSFEPETLDYESIISGADPKPPVEPEPQPPVKPPAQVEKTPPGDQVEEHADDFDPNARPKLGTTPAEAAKTGRPSNTAMREQIERIAAEKKELEEKYTTESQTRAELEAKLKQAEEEREAARKRFEEVQKPKGNLYEHEDVVAITAPWEKSFKNLVEELGDRGVKIKDPIAKQKVAISIAMDYNNAKKLEATDPEAAQEGIDAVRDRVAREFGDANTADAMKVIRDGAQRLVQAQQKIEELSRNYPEVEYKNHLEAYRGEVEAYTKLDSECFNPDPVLEQQDPYNPRVILKNLIATEPEVRAVADAAVKFSRKAMLPPPPINPADIAHLTPEQQRGVYKAQHDAFLAARHNLAKILPEALLARQILPGLQEEIRTLKAIIGGDRSAHRGKGPTLDEEPHKEEEDEEGDITKFTPSNPEMDKFKAENGLR